MLKLRAGSCVSWVAAALLLLGGASCDSSPEQTHALVESFAGAAAPPDPSPCPPASATSSCTLHALADTSVYSKQPTDAGKRKILCVANVTNNPNHMANGGIVRSLFAFDVSALPKGAQVTSAALTLHSWRAKSLVPEAIVPVPLALYKQGATGSWDEGSSATGPDGSEATGEVCIWAGDGSIARATFANSSLATLDASTVASASMDQDFTFSSAAMVADVNSWINQTSPNNGWSVRLNDETQNLGVALAPRETTQVDANGKTRGPRLLLNYRKAAGQTCSTTAECASGVCVGGVCCSAACSPTDAQCQTASCTAGTGACVRTNKTNGLACNDNKACTATDVCTSGVCGGTLSCPAPAACKTAATCAANGTCAYGNIAVNTACNDGNPATSGETCDGNGNCLVRNLGLGQVCSANAQCASLHCVNSVCCGVAACTTTDAQCQTAMCGAGTGTCVVTNKANGTTCTDGNACTTGDACSAGRCTTTGTVTCAAPAVCRAAGVCQTSGGSCTYALLAPGTACNDNNPATTGEKCDSAGNCLVPASTWSAPVTLDSGACCAQASLDGLFAAIAPNGDALAAWQHPNTSGTWVGYYSVGASRYSFASNSWAGMTLLNDSSRPVTDAPRVALDANALGTVLWDDWDPTFLNTSVWSRSVPSTGIFSTAVSPEPSQPLGAIAQAGASTSGTVFSVWLSGSNDNTSARVRHWGTLVSGSWTTPKLFSTSNPAALAVDGQNNVMAVWTQTDGSRVNPYWSRYSSGAWSTPARLDVGQLGTGVSWVVVAVANNGNALAVWLELDSASASTLVARSFTPAGGWSATTTTLASIASSSIGGLSLAMNASSDSVVTWQVQDTTTTSLMTRYAVAGGAWGSALVAQSQPKASGYFASSIALDASGNATLPWMPTGGAIKSQRLTRGGSAWSAPVTVDAPVTQSLDISFSFAMSPNGQGILAWVRSPTSGSSGTSSVMASVFR